MNMKKGMMLLILLLPGLWQVLAAGIEADRAQLDKEIDGWLLWTEAPGRKGPWRVAKARIGDWKPVDLGEGRYARWSWDGKKIAVCTQKRELIVMDADGKNRKKVADQLGLVTGSPMDWMPGDQRIAFVRVTGKGRKPWDEPGKIMILDLASGQAEDVKVAPRGNSDLQVSADGRWIAARERYEPHRPLVAYDLKNNKRIVYGIGCCAGVSPNGEWVSNNHEDHHNMTLHNLDGVRKIFGVGAWDNPHWSNHDNYIAANGNRLRHLQVFKVSEQRWFRLYDSRQTKKRHDFPDLFITNLDTAPKLVIKGTEDVSTDWKAARDWPGDETGLVFRFSNAAEPNAVRVEGKTRKCSVRMSGFAHYGLGYTMRFPGRAVTGRRKRHVAGEGSGVFIAEGDAGEAILEACRAAGEFSLEMVIAPGARNSHRSRKGPVPGAIMAFGPRGQAPNFAVWQYYERSDKRNVLSLYFGPSGWKGIAEHRPINPGRAIAEVERHEPRPIHLVLSCGKRGVTVYRDGVQAGRLALRCDPGKWKAGELTFGNLADGSMPWNGVLEGVAVYARTVGAGEAAKKHELYRRRLEARRKATPRYTVSAKLIATAEPPPLKGLPYPRATVVYTYEVLRGPKGVPELARGRKINVVHWAILGGKPLPSIRKKFVKGATFRKLVLEPGAAHNEAETEGRGEPEDMALAALPTYMYVGD